MKHLHVNPHDSALSFRVASKSRPEIEHLVDLAGLNGNGECSCENFEFRLKPEIEKTGKIKRCVHIEAARSALCDAVVERIIGMADEAH